MATAITIAKAFIAVVAAAGFILFAARKAALNAKLKSGTEKAKATGDTSDVEAVFTGRRNSK